MDDKFKALGHDDRLTIYRALLEEQLCVCEITELLEMSQPAVSQHLSELSQAELIDSERKGQWTFYFSTKNQVNEALEDLLRNKNEKLLDDIKAIKNQNLCELRDSEGEL